MGYAFTREISPPSPYIPPPFKAQIPASRLKSHPPGSNPSLQAQIPASRLKSQPPGPHGRTKVPLCSTGHRPLRGRCPATHHLQSPTYEAGQRVSLTTYCPWATGSSLQSKFGWGTARLKGVLLG